MTASVRSKAVTGRPEVGPVGTVVDGFEDQADDLLHHLISRGGHPQSTLPHHPHEFRDG